MILNQWAINVLKSNVSDQTNDRINELAGLIDKKPKVAVYNKRMNEVRYWDSLNTQKDAYVKNLGEVESLIEASGVEQKLKVV